MPGVIPPKQGTVLRKVKVKKTPRNPLVTTQNGVQVFDPLAGHTLKDKQNRATRRAQAKALAQAPHTYTTSHSELAGETRIDPGAGLVSYGGKTEAQFKAKQAQIQKEIDASRKRLASLGQSHRSVGSILGGALKGAGHAVEGYYGSKLHAALEGDYRGIFRQELSLFGGKALANAATKGDISHPGSIALELGLLPLPFLKGFPTIGTALYRAGQGAARLRGAEEAVGVFGAARQAANLTRADRTQLVREAAQGLSPTVKTASSAPARVVSNALEKVGAPDPLVKFVRNDPRAKRWFTNGDSQIWVDAAHSRTGKLFESAYDKARPVLSAPARIGVWSKPVLRARTDVEKWAQALAEHYHEAYKQNGRAVTMLAAAMPKRGFQRLSRLQAPEYYALRMVGKGIAPDVMVSRFAGLAQAAREAGNTDEAARLIYHAAMAQKAAPMVMVSGDKVVFSDQASQSLVATYKAIDRAAKDREAVYAALDILSETNAQMRLTNEELWYYGATWQNTASFIDKQIVNSPNRKALYDILVARDPTTAAAGMEAIDLQAKNWAIEKRARLANAIATLKAEVKTSSDPMKAKLLRDAEIEYKRGIQPDTFYKEWKATHGEFPADVRAAYGEGTLMELQPYHDFPQAKADANLRAKLNPRTQGNGHPGNDVVFGDFNGQQVAILGDLTPEMWVQRVLVTMPDAAERAAWAAWYKEFQPTFEGLFGPDAEKIMRGFGVSQANASPADGLKAVFRILDAVSKGKKVKKGYGSVVAASIAKAIQGDHIDKGIAAKLSDFIDSLLGLDTRTWMGHAPEGGSPVAVDVHAGRDRGLVDAKIEERLKEQFGLVKGKDYVIDSPGAPSGSRYERVAEWYNDLTDHLNQIGFDGRNDWKPSEVQALGWASIQKLHGVEPQNFAAAIGRNTHTVSFEATLGKGGLGAGLSLEQTRAVAQAMEPEIRSIVSAYGGYLGDLRYDVSHWKGQFNTSIHADVIGSEANAQKILTKIAQAFDQSLVQGTRTITRAGAKATLVVSSDAFSDVATKVAFGTRLRELVPELAQHGDMPFEVQGVPGFAIITSRGYLGPKTTPAFLKRYADAITQVGEEMGIDVRYNAKNTQIKIGDQRGARKWDATSGRAGQVDNFDPLVRDARRKLEGLIADAHGGSSPADLASRGEVHNADVLSGGPESGNTGSVGSSPETDRGRQLLEKTPGYEEAAAQIRAGTVPTEWLNKLVAEGKGLHQYDKYRIGAHLNQLSREGGGPSLYDANLERSVPGIQEYLGRTVVRGMYRPRTNEMIVGPYGTLPTALHELAHMRQFRDLLSESFLSDVRQLLGVQGDDWTEKQMEELAHIFEATFYGFDSQLSKLPDNIKTTLEGVRKAFLKQDSQGYNKAAQKMLQRLDESGPLGQRIRDAVENMHYFQSDPDAYAFHGASDAFRDRATTYMPEVPAMPAQFKEGMARQASLIRSRLSGGKTNLWEHDSHLSHEFRGHLLETGAFDEDVIKGTVAAQMKASTVHAMSFVRNHVLPISTEVPHLPDDIAIPVDKAGFKALGRQVNFVQRMLQSIDESKPITAAQLNEVDHEELLHAMGAIFYGSTKDSEAAAKALAEDMLMGVQKPIPGVRWVRREALLSIGDVFKPRGQQSAALKPLDWLNDYARAAVLIAKPSYIPMNLAGNAVMLLMQQGAFAPMNMYRAFRMNAQIGDYGAFIDHLMGAGQIKTLLGGGNHIPGVGTYFFNPIADVSNLIVDKYPRRAAFLYEARHLGYDSPDKVVSLLTDPNHVDDLTLVSKRAKNALVDYENLSDFERRVMTRLIFVYPWLKGATFWTGRWAKDHPVQAMAAAAMLYWQQDRLKETLPNGYPDYLKWWVPIGSATRAGQDVPVGFRLDQFLTFLTPLDIASDFVGTGFGIGPGRIGGNTLDTYLNPAYQEILKTFTGWDGFRKEQVSTHFVDFWRRMFLPERFLVYTQIQKILHPDPSKGVYRKDRKDAWFNLFLGSMAPVPISPETAAVHQTGTQLTKSQSLGLWKDKVEKMTGHQLLPEVIQWKKNEQNYNSAERSAATKAGGGGLTEQERAFVLLQVYAEANSQTLSDRAEEGVKSLSEGQAKALVSRLRTELGLTQIGMLDRAISKYQKQTRIQTATTTNQTP